MRTPFKPYVQRHTGLHPALWAPYKITAYPHGFAGAPGEPDLPPVWMPEARIIGTEGRQKGHACTLLLDLDSPSLDDALSACWEHYASLH